MSSPVPFAPVAELLERGLDIRNVYGEPVRHGDVTVIPVARVEFAFGAGGGRATGDGPADAPRAHGAGGGGAARITPAGALHIGADGTRFVGYPRLLPLAAAAVAGVALGWLLAKRAR